MSKSILRNPFVALCDYASRNNWCWNIFCTTCGHGSFRVAFSKLIQDQHPDNDSFWSYGKSNSDLLNEVDNNNDFWREASVVNQLKLTAIVASAKISDIQEVTKFPDWLGYIGLVINHCSNREAGKLLSDAFIPQFVSITKNNKELNDHLKKMRLNNSILSIYDLSRIESAIVSLNYSQPPM